MKMNSKELCKRWGISCKQARYSEWGNWYAAVSAFPLALLDSTGYIVFKSFKDLQGTEGVRISKQINIRNGISNLKGYTRIVSQVPEEVNSKEVITEGNVEKVLVNRFERSSRARKACLEYYGFSCQVCGWSGKETYGEEAEKLIHVHHLKEISSLGKSYEIDPIKELIPVCPNCHAFIHSFRPALDIEIAKKKILKPNKSLVVTPLADARVAPQL